MKTKQPQLVSWCICAALCAFTTTLSFGQVILLEDDFSNGYTSDPAWTVTAGSWNWTDGNDYITTAGIASNAYLRTTEFTPISTGIFTFSAEVNFSSLDVSGNNRFYLRMRDSTSGLAGYEIAIAQGTMANTTFTALGGATLGTQTKTTTPTTFGAGTWTTITWTRDAEGAMEVYVGDKLYLSISASSVSYFDTIELGGRVYINESTSYYHSFTNVQLSTIPEPGSLGLFAASALTCFFLLKGKRRF